MRPTYAESPQTERRISADVGRQDGLGSGAAHLSGAKVTQTERRVGADVSWLDGSESWVAHRSGA